MKTLSMSFISKRVQTGAVFALFLTLVSVSSAQTDPNGGDTTDPTGGTTTVVTPPTTSYISDGYTSSTNSTSNTWQSTSDNSNTDYQNVTGNQAATDAATAQQNAAAGQTVVNTDQTAVNNDQSALNAAQAQYAKDQKAGASASVLAADQSSITSDQNQLNSDNSTLSTDEQKNGLNNKLAAKSAAAAQGHAVVANAGNQRNSQLAARQTQTSNAKTSFDNNASSIADSINTAAGGAETVTLPNRAAAATIQANPNDVTARAASGDTTVATIASSHIAMKYHPHRMGGYLANLSKMDTLAQKLQSNGTTMDPGTRNGILLKMMSTLSADPAIEAQFGADIQACVDAINSGTVDEDTLDKKVDAILTEAVGVPSAQIPATENMNGTTSAGPGANAAPYDLSSKSVDSYYSN